MAAIRALAAELVHWFMAFDTPILLLRYPFQTYKEYQTLVMCKCCTHTILKNSKQQTATVFSLIGCILFFLSLIGCIFFQKHLSDLET